MAGENAVHIAAAIATAAGSQLMKLLLAACREEDLPQVAAEPRYQPGASPLGMRPEAGEDRRGERRRPAAEPRPPKWR